MANENIIKELAKIKEEKRKLKEKEKALALKLLNDERTKRKK